MGEEYVEYHRLQLRRCCWHLARARREGDEAVVRHWEARTAEARWRFYQAKREVDEAAIRD